MQKHGKWLYLLIYFDVNYLLASGIFLNKWAVKVDGGQQVADYLAEEHGFRNLGQVCFCIFVLSLQEVMPYT